MSVSKMDARTFLIKSRLYRFFSFIFAFVGLAVFATTFFHIYNGQLTNLLRDAQSVGYVIIPLLPAVILAILADRSERNSLNISNKMNIKRRGFSR